jgi:hypothetical protein
MRVLNVGDKPAKAVSIFQNLTLQTRFYNIFDEKKLQTYFLYVDKHEKLGGGPGG